MFLVFREPRLLLAYLAIACLGFVPLRAETVTLNAQEQVIANHLVTDPNQHRPFLQLDPVLTKVARARAADMAARGYFDHVDPQGYGPDWKVQQAGYQLPAGWTNPVSLNYIESIAAGESTGEKEWQDWMNSTPHRDHLLALESGYVQETSYGVGMAYVPGSQYTYYWVVITCPSAQSPPHIAIISPASSAKVTTATVTVTGNTSGTGTVQSVAYQLQNAAGTTAYKEAWGTTNWSATVSGLIPGPNTIRAESIGANSTVLAQTSTVVNYMVYTPLTVNVSGQGTVTSGYLGTTQRGEGFHDVITATPAAGWLFTGWTGTVSSSHATLDFVMAEGQVETATFVPNPFLSRRGGYAGLLEGGAAGLVKLSIEQGGGFTGQVKFEGHAYVLSGKLAYDGTTTVTIKRHNLPSLVVTLNLDVTGTSGLSGSVTDGTTTETFGASQAYQKSAGKFASAGRYTVSIPADPQNTDPNVPQGYGYGTLTVNSAGGATIAGSVADGRTFTGSSVATGDGTLTFYIPMYTGQGGLFGQVTLRDTGTTDLDGSFRWVKPSRPKDLVAPNAFDTTVPVSGSLYHAPAPKTTVIPVPDQQDNSQLIFGDGNLESQVVQPATLNTANRLSVVQPLLSGLKVTINPSTGTFSGSFTHPVTKATSRLRGVIFQKANAGYGYFLGASASGYTNLAPAQATSTSAQ